jgi:hypothetical protein
MFNARVPLDLIRDMTIGLHDDDVYFGVDKRDFAKYAGTDAAARAVLEKQYRPDP